MNLPEELSHSDYDQSEKAPRCDLKEMVIQLFIQLDMRETDILNMYSNASISKFFEEHLPNHSSFGKSLW